MKKFKHHLLATLLAVTPFFCIPGVFAQDMDAVQQTIRVNLHKHMPVWPQVEEVRKTPIDGLYEVRIGDGEILYTDATANYVISGDMLDLQNMRNLTQERVSELTAVSFKDLPLQDAIMIKRGDGQRKMAVFEDPMCSYCYRFEQQFQSIDNVTVYVFLYPILSAKSHEMSKNIWCAKDQKQAWLNWMLKKEEPAAADCDAELLKRNVEYGRKHKIDGTPTMLFEDGSRIPGAVDPEMIEAYLQRVDANKK